MPFPVKLATIVLPVLVLDVMLLWTLLRAYPGGWRAVWRNHRPILLIALGYGGIIPATLVVGSGVFHVIAHNFDHRFVLDRPLVLL